MRFYKEVNLKNFKKFVFQKPNTKPLITKIVIGLICASVILSGSFAYGKIYDRQFERKITNLEFEAKAQISEKKAEALKIEVKSKEKKIVALNQAVIVKTQALGKAEQEKEVAETKATIAKTDLENKKQQDAIMDADKDGDGLNNREETKLGTSDDNKDSDNDGISDKEDLHPAGGGRYLAQEFKWTYENKNWSWTHSIHEDWYEYYKNKSRKAHGVEYITENDPFIKDVAKKLKETANKEGYHLTTFIMGFIQGLEYVDDGFTGFNEYPKYPVETFVEKNGDCEDTAYLAASIISAANIGVALLQYDDHMAIGVKTVPEQEGQYYDLNDGRYYYYETTASGWYLGEMPSEYRYSQTKVIRVGDNEILYLTSNYQEERSTSIYNGISCYPSTAFPNFYWDGNQWYIDSDCTRTAIYGVDIHF